MHRQLMRHHLITKVAIQYVERNRQELSKQYTTFEAFNKRYEPTEPMRLLLEEASNKDIEMNEQEWKEAAPLIGLQIKALMARNLWTTSEYFEVINQSSDFVNKAVEILQNENLYFKTLQQK